MQSRRWGFAEAWCASSQPRELRPTEDPVMNRIGPGHRPSQHGTGFVGCPPVYNEDDNVSVLTIGLISVFDQRELVLEILFVEDGSTDESVQKINAFESADERVRIISLARNFGHQVVITAEPLRTRRSDLGRFQSSRPALRGLRGVRRKDRNIRSRD